MRSSVSTSPRWASWPIPSSRAPTTKRRRPSSSPPAMVTPIRHGRPSPTDPSARTVTSEGPPARAALRRVLRSAMPLDLATLAQPAESKIVLVVMDGLGGYADANHGTELEDASTPNLDALVAE